MSILPRPQKSVLVSGEFVIDNNTTIYSDGQFSQVAQLFSQLVYNCCQVDLPFTTQIDKAQIIFKMDEQCDEEGYVLIASQGIITVSCSTTSGCFYAVQTLRQMLKLDEKRQRVSCYNGYIEDKPKYKYRGLHLDIARHFFGVDVIMQIVDLMSQVKLNKLHLHLCDDQGFRVQIDKYPLLNQVGSVRQGSVVVKDGKRYVDDVTVKGYLTKQDVEQLVQYANSRHVDIVPEIDVPGHLVAVLASYPQYSCTGNVSEVRKQWGISKDLLCAGNDEAVQFVKDILDEVCQMFPYEYVHLGGDEAPKDRWCNCKLCRERMSQLGFDDFDQLQTHLVEQLRLHLQNQGKKVICWNDGLTKWSSNEIVSQAWAPKTRKKSAKQASLGRKTIMSPFFDLYFDYPYAMTPLRKTLRFNAQKWVKKNARNNVWGVEGALWTEYVVDTDKLYFNLLPRLDALASCAWGSSGKGFAKALSDRLRLYDSLGLNYNRNALRSGYSLCITKKFFKQDSYVEVKRQKAQLAKRNQDK